MPSDELVNSEIPTLPPPPTIHYTEKHVRPSSKCHEVLVVVLIGKLF